MKKTEKEMKKPMETKKMKEMMMLPTLFQVII
jgi:hypothetical protein